MKPRWKALLIGLASGLTVSLGVWAAFAVAFPSSYSCTEEGIADLEALERVVDRSSTWVGAAQASSDCLDGGHAGVDGISPLRHLAVVSQARANMGCQLIPASAKRPRHPRLLCHTEGLAFRLSVDSTPGAQMTYGNSTKGYNTEVWAALVNED